MKRYILLLSLTAFVFAGDKTANFKVKGMSCQYSCANKVKTVLTSIEGVKNCDVDFETSTAKVIYDDKAILGKDIEKILSNKTNFDVSIENKQNQKKSPIKEFFSRFFKS